MPINVAMPIAHVIGGADYAPWYAASGDCILSIDNYFNQFGAKGLSLTASAAAAGVTNIDVWNLYALTDGFLSFRNDSLILRLPRELNRSTTKAYNSGKLFLSLTPGGPQLRHVVYAFSASPGQAAVENRIRALLTDAAHLGRTITRVQLPVSGTQLLQEYLAAAPANLDAIVEDFLFGAAELFVRAGDVIGNFEALDVEIRFHDSCGNITPGAVTGSPIIVKGRPLNPSYFLYLLRSQENTVTARRVNILTNMNALPRHPLDHLLALENIPATGNLEQALDVTAANPPKPLHLTVTVQTAAGVLIADRGVGIGALGEWHESRNSSQPYTASPVAWRHYGSQSGEVMTNEFCRFLTQVKAGRNGILPGGAAFDHSHTPEATHRARVRTYWERYDRVFNLLAAALEIPCEILLALACTETATGDWFAPLFASSREMHVIRMEPLLRQPATIEPANAIRSGQLATYMAITGGIRGHGANAYLPAPWNAAGRVIAAQNLTWGQLGELISHYPGDVRVSPGVMQTLVRTAKADMEWIERFHGPGFIHGLSFVHAGTGVMLTADAPPPGLNLLFSDWFAVAVDAAGANTAAAPIDGTLTRMKRALHNIIAGACHVKRIYNSVTDGGRNMICDFDLPTIASGYNDGALSVAAAVAGDDVTTKWQKLFALQFYDERYPQNGPKYFNAAVGYFDTDFVDPNTPLARPSFRLWRP